MEGEGPTLISLTEDNMKKLDKGNIDCCTSVDLRKAFDTVEHDSQTWTLWHIWYCKQIIHVLMVLIEPL